MACERGSPPCSSAAGKAAIGKKEVLSMKPFFIIWDTFWQFNLQRVCGTRPRNTASTTLFGFGPYKTIPEECSRKRLFRCDYLLYEPKRFVEPIPGNVS